MIKTPATPTLEKVQFQQELRHYGTLLATRITHHVEGRKFDLGITVEYAPKSKRESNLLYKKLRSKALRLLHGEMASHMGDIKTVPTN